MGTVGISRPRLRFDRYQGEVHGRRTTPRTRSHECGVGLVGDMSVKHLDRAHNPARTVENRLRMH